jgi:hypothetical protein
MEFYAVDAPLHVCLVLLRWLVCGQMGAQTPRTARQGLAALPIKSSQVPGNAIHQELKRVLLTVAFAFLPKDGA